MSAKLPFPDKVIQRIIENRVHAFSHRLVMDAVDVSGALNRHLLLYGIEGVFQLDTESASWRLPPSRAGWIPAGQPIRTRIIKPVRCISIFFQEDFIQTDMDQCIVFNAPFLIQEMFKYTLRWNEKEPNNNTTSDRFFLTLFDLCQEEMRSNSLFTLPKAKSDDLKYILDYTLEHLADDLRLDDLATLVSMSKRTLTRRLNSEIHMTWGQYLNQARMMYAMDHLARGKTVTETSFEVGFSNVSAFTTAFHRYSGMPPTQFQSQFR